MPNWKFKGLQTIKAGELRDISHTAFLDACKKAEQADTRDDPSLYPDDDAELTAAQIIAFETFRFTNGDIKTGVIAADQEITVAAVDVGDGLTLSVDPKMIMILAAPVTEDRYRPSEAMRAKPFQEEAVIQAGAAMTKAGLFEAEVLTR